MTNPWTPWTVDGDRRIIAPESEWRLPNQWNASAEHAGVRDTVIVGVDVFEDYQGLFWKNGGVMLRSTDGYVLGTIYDDIRKRVSHTDIRRDIFAAIDSCPHLDFVLTTGEPGRVRGMINQCHPVHTRFDFAVKGIGEQFRDNLILSCGQIRTQADADRLVPELLKLSDLCGGLGMTAEPWERVSLSSWLRNGGGIHCSGCLPHRRNLDGTTHQLQTIEHPGVGIDLLTLTGGIPEHVESLAGQCRSAWCRVLDLRKK